MALTKAQITDHEGVIKGCLPCGVQYESPADEAEHKATPEHQERVNQWRFEALCRMGVTSTDRLL